MQHIIPNGNPVAKFSTKFNKAKVYKNKKKDYQRIRNKKVLADA